MADQPVIELRNDDERKAYPQFQQIMPLLGLAKSGYGCEAYRRAERARFALSGWRRAAGQRQDYGEELALTVRVAAATFADQIEAAAPARMDDEAIRWVLAGLRCPAQPFCAGCTACQTVTSPHRPLESAQL
jgi:hypothetical protein